MLNFYRKLIQLRRNEPALNVGNYRSVYSDKQLIAYAREAGTNRFLIVLNLSHRPCFFRPDAYLFSGKIQLSTEPEREGESVSDALTLGGDEGVIVRLNN